VDSPLYHKYKDQDDKSLEINQLMWPKLQTATSRSTKGKS